MTFYPDQAQWMAAGLARRFPPHHHSYSVEMHPVGTDVTLHEREQFEAFVEANVMASSVP
jgi:hypothetical protein